MNPAPPVGRGSILYPNLNPNNISMNPIYITSEDHTRLSLLVRSTDGPVARQLRDELARAVVVDQQAIAPSVVRMGSRVEIQDVVTGEVEEYTLTFPERANVDERKLSVLAPIGTAILGYAEGQEVSWPTPGGARRIRLGRVTQPDTQSVLPQSVS